MKIVEIDRPEILSRSGAPRSKGFHVSQLRREWMDVNHVKGHEYHWRTDVDEYSLDLMAAVGFAWEDVFGGTLKGAFVQPAREIQKDGIWGTPDGVDFDNGEVIEFKATWRSAYEVLTDDHDNPGAKYFWQIKSYCHMMGMTKARLIVFYVCGERRGSGWPKVRQFRLTFGKKELREHWEEVLKIKRSME